MKAPPPEAEHARVETLRQFKVLDTEPEEVFDEVTRLAALITQTPTALITLVDSDRQWFKSRFGFKPRETPRDISFCAHAILQPGPLVVKDTLDDERFRDNPLVLKDPYIRFYAGFPLTSTEGHRLGTLCVLDKERRILFTEQLEAMESLSKVVMALLEARRTVAFLEGSLNAKRQRIAELERGRPADGQAAP